MPSLLATLGLNVKPFERGLHDAQHAAKEAGGNIGESLSEFGTKALAGFSLVSLVESAVEAAERIKTLSNEFRVSTDTIQVWDKGAKKAGMTAEDVGNAFNRLKKAREQAIGDGATAGKFLEAFGSFGIGLGDLKNSATSTEEIMDRIRGASAAHPITAEEDVAGMELMGKSGARMLSALEQIHNLGPIKVISKEDIEQLHEASERLEEIKRQATIGVAKGAGLIADISARAGATFEGLKQFMSGRASFNEARKIAREAIHGPDEAPPGEKSAEGESGRKGPLSYSNVRVVDLENKKEQAELERLREEIAQRILQNNLKSMTVEERREELKRLMAEHEKAAISAEFGEGDEKKALQEKLEAQKLKGELLGLEKKHGGYSVSVTDRERIGAQANAPVSLSTSTPERHLSVSMQMEKHLSNLVAIAKAERVSGSKSRM